MHSQCIAPHSSDDRALGTVLQHTAALKPESFLRAYLQELYFLTEILRLRCHWSAWLLR